MAREFQPIMYVDHNAEVNTEDKENFSCDSLDVEKFIFSLDYKSVLLLLFKNIGYDYKEISKIMGINKSEYYKLCNSLKTKYEKEYR